MKSRWWIICVLTCSVALVGGCKSPCPKCTLKNDDVYYHTERYANTNDYNNLKWVADNCLCVGMTRKEVEWLLGYGEEPYVGDPEYEVLYMSERGVPFGHILAIELEDGLVKSWGWIDE